MLRALRRRLAAHTVSRARRLPLHVGIIPDGNRRWARRRRLPAWMGHARGYERLREVLNFLWDVGVRFVTVYTLSRENCLRRPREELGLIHGLIVRAVHELRRDERVREGRLRFRFIGDEALLPRGVLEELRGLERDTEGNGPCVLTACVCYSGEWELVEALRRAARLASEAGVDASSITIENYRSLLPLGDQPAPDLVIRSGGEYRLSNFLIPHIAYTELYFIKKYWPDVDEYDVARALLSYSRRTRRFGR